MSSALAYQQSIECLLADDEAELALEASDAALAAYAHLPIFHRLRARALTGLGRASDAVSALERATLSLTTDDSLSSSLGNLCVAEFRDFELAERHFLRALRLNPRSFESYLGFARCQLQHGAFEQLWHQRPAEAQTGLLLEASFVQLRNLGRYTEARTVISRWLEEGVRRSAALVALARIEEEADHNYLSAFRHLKTALRLSAASTEAWIALIALLVKMGRWTEATQQLQRMMLHFGNSYPSFPTDVPNWDGSPLDGKIVLLDNTLAMGYGDLIHYSRFATKLHERGASVGIRSRQALKPLLATIPGVNFVVSFSEQPSNVDYIADMSLLWIYLGLGMNQVSQKIPYLSVATSTSTPWFLPTDGTLRVGVVARSADRHPSNSFVAKDVPSQEFGALQNIPRARFYSFERTPKSPPLRQVLDRSSVEDVVADFSEAGKLIAQLDIVVTVDTALAHLTGALGVPGIVLLPYSSDSRWLLNREDTPWYPSLRLIRQQAPGDWGSVMKQCRVLLETFALDRSKNALLA